MVAPVIDMAGPLLAQAGFSDDGLWAFLYVVSAPGASQTKNPGMPQDYDLCWIYLGARPPTIPLTLFVASMRNGEPKSRWVPLMDVKPAMTVNLACGAAPMRIDKYSLSKVCDDSTIKLHVGLDGSPSEYLTSFYFEDRKNPLNTLASGKPNPVAPGYAKHLSTLVKDNLAIAPLATR